MDLVQQFIKKAKQSPARIVYPEGGDGRIVAAAARAAEMGLAEPVVLGDPDEVGKLAADGGFSTDGFRVVSPRDEDAIARYADAYAQAREMRVAIARRLVRKPLSFGGMMLRTGEVDGMVAGVASATASVIQAAALTVGFQEGISTPSSFFIMIIPEFMGERDKPLIFADCAVNISPNARQLAEIGVASGANARALLGLTPRIAYLSFATKGSAAHADVTKVTEAVAAARELAPDLAIDGELQADAALVPSVAAKKVGESPVAGQANVLVFPDLDAGNMAYKLVERLAGAKALGPVMQGFAKPVNDMSRGATVEDLIGVTAITVIQARGASAG